MAKKWYEQPLRIAALQCNFEGGREKTLDVADRWMEMGFNVEQLFHPTADSYSALFNPARHGEILAEYLARAKKNGLRIILYLNVHIIGPSDEDKRETWAQRSAAGGFPRLYDTYYANCVNGPWRDHFFGVLESLRPYDIDGLFLDGPGFVSGGCHCAWCRELYGREEGKELVGGADLSEFSRRSLDRFIRESYKKLKSVKPDAVSYINLAVMHLAASSIRLPDALDYGDIVGTEGGFMFYGPPKDAYLFKPSLAAKVMEAIAPNHPRVIFMAADQKPWSWLPHAPAETRLCIASTVANGANIWYGLHGSTALLDTPGGRAGGEMIRFLAAHEDAYTDTVSAARVAVLYSLDTERHYRKRAETSDFYGKAKTADSRYLGDFADAFSGVCDMLARSSLPFDTVVDVAPSAAAWRRYDCLILPTSACLSDATVAAVRDYVRGGGNVIGMFDTSLYDGAGEPRADFGLTDVFGVHHTGEHLKLGTFNYFKQDIQDALFDGVEIPLMPAPPLALVVRPVDGSEVLARFLKPLAGRYVPLTAPEHPALVRNRYGKGRSLYCAGTFGEMAHAFTPPEYRLLLCNAVREFSRQPVTLKTSLGNVEMVVRRQEGATNRLIVHLVNYAGLVPRPFVKVCPQDGLELRLTKDLRVSSARALVAGADCAIAGTACDSLISLPRIHEYEVVSIELDSER